MGIDVDPGDPAMPATRGPLVSPAWLAARLDDPAIKVIQLLYEPDVDDYADGHVPGAQAHFWKTLLWDSHERQFATPAQIAQRFGALGIRPTDTVVLYSGRNQYAMYGYWVAHTMCGHGDVRVLDGGLKAWQAAGHPVTRDVPVIEPVVYPVQRPSRDDSTRVPRDEVLAGIGKPGRRLLDARSPEEFRGERVKPAPGFDHGAESYGRIPGAVHVHARDLMDPIDFTVKPDAELESIFRAAGVAPDQADEVIAYCRLSHRASAIWFTMTQLLGWRHIRVYDGSWTEWGSSVGLPVER